MPGSGLMYDPSQGFTVGLKSFRPTIVSRRGAQAVSGRT